MRGLSAFLKLRKKIRNFKRTRLVAASMTADVTTKTSPKALTLLSSSQLLSDLLSEITHTILPVLRIR